MIDLNITASLCAENAKRRGKVGYDVSHWLTAGGISEELMEFIKHEFEIIPSLKEEVVPEGLDIDDIPAFLAHCMSKLRSPT